MRKAIRPGPFCCLLLLVVLPTRSPGASDVGATPLPSAERASSAEPRYWAGEVVSRVPVREPLVAITFDDGPREPHTSQILDVLRDQGVKATFFLIGDNARRHPAVVRRIAREGHAIGNHSWSHPRLGDAGVSTARDEIGRTDDLIERITGIRTTLFRPPYGDIGARLAGPRGVPAERGHLLVMWSVQADDWATGSPLTVAVRTVRRVHPGAIVLLHDGGGDRAHTVTATRWLVGRLARQGYRMVTVPELLAAADR